MSISSKAEAALTYLVSVLQEEDFQELTITKTGAYLRTDEDGVEELYTDGINPIQDMHDHLTEQICTDCLKDESNFKSSFFVDYMRAYIDGLILQYGTRVPITRTLAKVIMEHKLTEHMVEAVTGDGYIDYLDATDYEDFVQPNSTYQFFLIVE